MSDASVWTGAALGAGLILINLVLLISALVFVVYRHERADDNARKAAESKADRQHAEVMRNQEDIKKLTLHAIAGRKELEDKVDAAVAKLEEHSGSLRDLKAQVTRLDQSMGGGT